MASQIETPTVISAASITASRRENERHSSKPPPCHWNHSDAGRPLFSSLARAIIVPFDCSTLAIFHPTSAGSPRKAALKRNIYSAR